MSGAGPAAPPPPAMTSPGRASTWISLKQRSAAKQGLEPRMWRSTADRWRTSPRLERWPVAEQWTQTKRPHAGWAGCRPGACHGRHCHREEVETKGPGANNLDGPRRHKLHSVPSGWRTGAHEYRVHYIWAVEPASRCTKN